VVSVWFFSVSACSTWKVAGGSETMAVIMGLIVALGLIGYLLFSIIRPEKF
jgi:K+-transporting ATPase KdpF subunit